jgi:hypothetical protein
MLDKRADGTGHPAEGTSLENLGSADAPPLGDPSENLPF